MRSQPCQPSGARPSPSPSAEAASASRNAKSETRRRLARCDAMQVSVQGAGMPLQQTLAKLDWPALAQELDASGSVVTPPILSADQCAELVSIYDNDALFRSRVVMARHGFGKGEYKYFAYPLPRLITSLRTSLYERLAPIANTWEVMLGREPRFPATHEDFLATCHAAGQARPTPLLLRYGSGDYNCLHQDLYGEHVFPLQAAFLLSRPNEDFTGGEFVLTEQRPRMQSRAEVAPLQQGQAIIFAVNERPVRGTKGVYRVKMRHGVSRIRSGARHTLGVIFHDAA
ncbi:MAG: proline hydroxylase [Sphingomonadales bacterium]|nr:MAG: proline hydroxylase [Sphingomonadales bacterium]